MISYHNIWKFVYDYLKDADSNLFNTRYSFQISFKIYSSHASNIHYITEDLVNDDTLACSPCAARAFLHQLYDNKYIKYESTNKDKRKKIIIPTNRLISAFESDKVVYKSWDFQKVCGVYRLSKVIPYIKLHIVIVYWNIS